MIKTYLFSSKKNTPDFLEQTFIKKNLKETITMNMIQLNKQHNKPDFDELSRMLSDLNEFLNEDANPNDKQWNENLNTIIDFQDSDGSFKLFDSYKIPSDARVDFCWMPTYICTAILMKAFMTDSSLFTLKEKSALYDGLIISCSRNLRGHGYEAFKGQIEALNIFIKAGLNEFMDLHPDFCPEFSEMINKIISDFDKRQSQDNFLGPWGESYEEEIKTINEYFSFRKVFVYGTLMNGESNHHYLQNSTCLGRATLKGYDMYDVGCYPAITPGDNLIIGEIYQVPKEDITSIDMLEGEGTLYVKKCETVTDAEGKTSFALVYVYIEDISGLEKIPAWKDYVWYVSYGSNMLKKRFLYYIEGGSFEGSRYRQPCRDTTPPLAIRTLEIPFDMYFGNYSGSWNEGGVSFLDTSKKGYALGVAYLITKEQFEHVAAQENIGRFPNGDENYGWYENIIDLEAMEGIGAKTITNNNLRDYNEPCFEYLETLRKGIKENWPEMVDEDIEDYLNNCIRR